MTETLDAPQLTRETRFKRVEQRRALHAASRREQILAIIHPPPGLARCELSTLLANRSPLVPGVNKVALEWIFQNLRRHSFRAWRGSLRLVDLSLCERRLLAKELLRASEHGWAKFPRRESA